MSINNNGIIPNTLLIFLLIIGGVGSAMGFQISTQGDYSLAVYTKVNGIGKRTFPTSFSTTTTTSSSLSMAGFGMATATSSRKKKNKKTKNNNNKKNNFNGDSTSTTTKTSSSTPFDVRSSLLKSEKIYDRLLLEHAKGIVREEEEEKRREENREKYGIWAEDDDDDNDNDYKGEESNKNHNNQKSTSTTTTTTITSEYVIAAKFDPSPNTSIPPGSTAVTDWIPVAQLCLVRPILEEDTASHSSSSYSSTNNMEFKAINASISKYRREISHVAGLGAQIFSQLPRDRLVYSIEPIDSFYRFVYEDVIEGGNNNNNNNNNNNKNKNQSPSSSSSIETMTRMTKAEARKVLHLEEDCSDPSLIQRAYRTLLFQYHPDRFVGVSRTEHEEEESSRMFANVKLARETLLSGLRQSSSTREDDGNSASSSSSSSSWYESLGGKSRMDFRGPIDLPPAGEAERFLVDGDCQCAIVGLNPETVMAFVARNQAASLRL
eukprot:CAMPEP_0184860786 /NCGR_PEP_ID=MMETSP0580-20130426/5598_1 /TAXON_ID=1118495 /ORGANISM="Dactyliosolen fragilissimus" /LENGTH=490 /DNA_ID=CAMNT_0027358011 /DNA_START=113 /DNA_END=1585 /DNA_ORIENTATION=+